MKNVFLVLIILSIPLSFFSQNLIEKNFPTKDGKIHYTDVVNVDSSLTPSDLYLNAKTWLVDAFKSSKAVIQTDDKEAKLIIVKSYIPIGHNSFVSNPKKWFVLKIEMKESRYRYALYDIWYEGTVSLMGHTAKIDKSFEEWMKSSGGKYSERKQQKYEDAMTDYCKELDTEFRNIISSLEIGMNKVKNDDW